MSKKKESKKKENHSANMNISNCQYFVSIVQLSFTLTFLSMLQIFRI